MDRQPGPDKADYEGKPQTEDKHNGTDIVIQDFGAMEGGVDVRAAAAGQVLAIRGGMPDIVVTEERRAKIQKQGCGNVIIIGHSSGWQTQYCHMKKGSLLVKKGDRVLAGQAIGQVGLSGLTEYPHLHFMVQQRAANKPIEYYDPFDGGLYEQGWNRIDKSGSKSFWRMPLDHVGPVVMRPLVSTKRATRKTLWRAQAETLPTDTPIVFIQARGFHTMKGDIWRFSLNGPAGAKRFRHDITQTRQRQLVGANANFKHPEGAFSSGSWTATVTLFRGGTVVKSSKTSFEIKPVQK